MAKRDRSGLPSADEYTDEHERRAMRPVEEQRLKTSTPSRDELLRIIARLRLGPSVDLIGASEMEGWDFFEAIEPLQVSDAWFRGQLKRVGTQIKYALAQRVGDLALRGKVAGLAPDLAAVKWMIQAIDEGILLGGMADSRPSVSLDSDDLSDLGLK